jgi:hypothetical protein
MGRAGRDGRVLTVRETLRQLSTLAYEMIQGETKMDRLLRAAGPWGEEVRSLLRVAYAIHCETGSTYVMVGGRGLRLAVRYSGDGAFWLHTPTTLQVA